MDKIIKVLIALFAIGFGSVAMYNSGGYTEFEDYAMGVSVGIVAVSVVKCLPHSLTIVAMIIISILIAYISHAGIAYSIGMCCGVLIVWALGLSFNKKKDNDTI